MSNIGVKAFTILEVTITMLIAGLLIGITYTSYAIIIKSYHSFTAKNEDMAVLISLDHLLRRDFDRAEFVGKTADGIALSWQNRTITYQFAPDFVIRNSIVTDTFKVQAQNLNTAFENAPLNDAGDTAGQNRIDEFDFTLIFQDQKIPYHYHKLYSSVNLFQSATNAVN